MTIKIEEIFCMDYFLFLR